MIARIFRPVFGIRRSSLLLGTAAVVLAFPAGAMANLYTLNTKPTAKIHGFKLRLDAFNTTTGYGGPNASDLMAFLVRTREHVTQTSAYSFNVHIKLKGKANLSSAQLNGTLVDSRGSINMTFHGKGATSRAPGQCGGEAGKKRSGTLSGSFTLKADKLGTIKMNSTQATLSTASNNCVAPQPCPTSGYLVEGFNGGYTVCASKAKSTSAVREVIRLFKAGDPVPKIGDGWAFQYTYAAKDEPTSDYTPNTSNLSTATVKGASGIHGSATYSGSKNSRHSHGKLTGPLSVNMATIGTVNPFASAKTISALQRHG
jgi:hypothetical protein